MGRKVLHPLLPSLRKKKKRPPKTSLRDDQLSAKTDLWSSLSKQMTHGATNMKNSPKQDRFTLADKARRFDQSVADSLLECNPKGWWRVKKKKIFLGKMKEQKITNNRSMSVEVQIYCNTRSYSNRLKQKG